MLFPGSVEKLSTPKSPMDSQSYAFLLHGDRGVPNSFATTDPQNLLLKQLTVPVRSAKPQTIRVWLKVIESPVSGSCDEKNAPDK